MFIQLSKTRDDEKVRIEYNIPNVLSAPQDEGNTVGSVKYYIDDILYADIPMYTTDASKIIDYEFCFRRFVNLWSLQY